MTFFPLDREILTSSLWAEGTPETYKVWSYLLLSADPRTGIVKDTVPAIALRCGFPIAKVQECVEYLAAPDKFSRTKRFEGRRLEILTDGGFRLLNYVQYRDKDYSTPRVQRWRAKVRKGHKPTKQTKRNGNMVKHSGHDKPLKNEQLEIASVKRDETGGNDREQKIVTETTDTDTDTDTDTENLESLRHVENGLENPSDSHADASAKPIEEQSDQQAAVTLWIRHMGSIGTPVKKGKKTTYRGGMSPSRIVQALGPVMRKHGRLHVLKNWQRYLEEQPAEYATPEDFAGKYIAWAKGRKKGNGAQDRNDLFRAALEGGLKREG